MNDYCNISKGKKNLKQMCVYIVEILYCLNKKRMGRNNENEKKNVVRYDVTNVQLLRLGKGQRQKHSKSHNT